MKRLLALCGAGALLAAAGALDTRTAPPPALVTYSVGSSGGLCIARADGSRRLRLTSGQDRAPSWSPGGRYVVFARQVGTAVRLVVADGRGRVVRRLTEPGAFADPAWSSDGKRIAYVSREGRPRIVIIGTAGRAFGEVLAAPGAAVSRPAWAPDGRIAYAEDVQADGGTAGTSRVVVVNADGTGRRVLVGQASDPAWSPDGSKIAYVAYASRLAETGFIVVANADGTGARRLTAGTAPESRPSWAPGGQRIAFARATAGRSEIVVRRVDRTGERAVTHARGAVDPAWRPAVVLPRASRRGCK